MKPGRAPRSWVRGLAFGLALAVAGPGAARAQERITPWGDDMAKIELSLLTVDVGDLVFNNFGHTAVRVHDNGSGRDLVFNWGIFDFGEPASFAFRFYKGILNYQLGVYPYHVARRQFQAERRTVWEDRINLTAEEKRRFLDKLSWNMEPENLEYSYQYFFDNCATRPRDYLDEAMGGKAKKILAPQTSGQRFRDMVRSHYATNPFIATSLDILMNARIDHVMTVWEKMFLPLTLRERYAGLPSNVTGPKGKPLPLLSDGKPLYTFPTPKPPPVNGWLFAVLAGTVPLALAFEAAKSRWRAMADKSWGLRLAGIPLIAWGFYAGVIGLLMPAAWATSDHLDLHHNANMWLFWPLDLVFLVMGFTLLLLGRPLRLRPRAQAFWRAYLVAHAAAIPVFAALWAAGVIVQDVSRVLLVFAPTALSACGFAYVRGLVRHEP